MGGSIRSKSLKTKLSKAELAAKIAQANLKSAKKK